MGSFTKSLAMLIGGGGGAHNTFLGSFLHSSLELLAILKGGAKSFHSFKGGARTVLPCLEGGGGGGGGGEVSDLQFSHDFVAPPPPRGDLRGGS